ncbi:MAG: adenine phosphoribosyltransferase [Nanoarchaeota archaeon]
MELSDFIRQVPNFPEDGVMFKDITPLLADPAAFRYCIDEMARIVKDVQYEKIGAFDARGFLFGAALAYKEGKPLFPIRKKGKLPGPTVGEYLVKEYGTDTLEIHTDAVRPGDRVLLVDDVFSIGGTLKAGIDLVERLGGTVACSLMLIELEEMHGREKLPGYDIRSLLRYPR